MEGGLGFRDLECFNEVMLAKQSWRLLQDSESLLAKSLKAKYFPRNNFLNATIGYNPSYTWRSIIAGRNIILKGIRWNIGSGDGVRVWHDPWLPSDLNFRVQSAIPAGLEDLRVRDLFLENSNRWDVELISNLFNENEAKLIKSIPLCQHSRPDRLVWHHSKDGVYSVKYGYTIAKHLKECESNMASSSGQRKKLWKWVGTSMSSLSLARKEYENLPKQGVGASPCIHAAEKRLHEHLTATKQLRTSGVGDAHAERMQAENWMKPDESWVKINTLVARS
ncbi:hypothetical protein DH2020_014756 [Rehmannia glutinosa]|uniref:Uncharacterized protein n=1 Tax=Rehmannia glutinosa TaxID=99300 RepID=A0ABR0WXW5_REHGL